MYVCRFLGLERFLGLKLLLLVLFKKVIGQRVLRVLLTKIKIIKWNTSSFQKYYSTSLVYLNKTINEILRSVHNLCTIDITFRYFSLLIKTIYQYCNDSSFSIVLHRHWSVAASGEVHCVFTKDISRAGGGVTTLSTKQYPLFAHRLITVTTLKPLRRSTNWRLKRPDIEILPIYVTVNQTGRWLDRLVNDNCTLDL